VSDETLRQLYDLLKWGPTSANGLPMRVAFLRTPEAKERLQPALMPGNVEKTMAAPVTAIVAYDELFYEKMPVLFPHNPGMRDFFANSPELANVTPSATERYRARTSSWQRVPSAGLWPDVRLRQRQGRRGVPSRTAAGEGEDDEMPAGRIKSNFLCNLGYGTRRRSTRAIANRV